MKVAIVGGGLTGLATGYFLSKKGHSVTIFEKNNYLGGLAGSFSYNKWSWPVEFYFHHIFTSDKEIINLAKELGLDKKIFYLKPKTSIFKDKTISQFDSPGSIMRSPLLSLGQKLQTGLVTAYLKVLDNWQDLEKLAAKDWLKKYYGEGPYKNIWEPLIKAKFGNKADKISMSWFWARIKKRSFKLGYFEAGFQSLIDKLAEQIKKGNGQIILNFEARQLTDINSRGKFDKVIFTTPVPVFLKITQNQLPKEYLKKLKDLEMFGAVNLVLILKEKFLADNTYWLNINEPNFPFVAVVEHTNFIDPKYYNGDHLLYIGGYYPPDHRFFKLTEEEILKEFLPFLKKINPSFNFKGLTVGYQLFRNPYAQPIIPVNYAKLIPALKTPLENVYLATMHQIYPWDRGTNYAVELGRKVAHEILKEN